MHQFAEIDAEFGRTKPEAWRAQGHCEGRQHREFLLPEKQQVVRSDRIASEARPQSVEDGVACGVGVPDFGESVRADQVGLDRHEIRPGPT